MISEIKINEEEAEKIIFPHLLYHQNKDSIIVILAHGREEDCYKGQVIFARNNSVVEGEYSDNWKKSEFKKFKGSITLTQ